MNDSSHPIPLEWLEPYHDGELDAERRALVDAHLPECATCQQELAELQHLRETLWADSLPDDALTDGKVFWQGLKARLPERAATAANASISPRQLFSRWLPGLSLLLLSSVVQVLAGIVAVVWLVLPPLGPLPAWAGTLDHLTADILVGWPMWFVPDNWSGLGFTVLILLISAGLAILYLAWLGYELRYGQLAMQAAP